MTIVKQTVKIPPGNISSSDQLRAVFTNPTEIAHWKGTLKCHYPIVFRGMKYADAEHAYKAHRLQASDLYKLCTEIIIAKFEQYPFLVDIIEANGDEEWIERCSHHVYGHGKYWEGNGLESGFIRCLLAAYRTAVIRKYNANLNG